MTIHFEGRLKGISSFDRVMAAACAFAEREGWQAEPIDDAEVTLARVREEEDWDYTGPAKGLALYPHERADPLRLEFDRDLYVQEFVKTQFAPPDIHVKITALLRLIAPEFDLLQVEDEGDYWATSDRGLLVRQEMIAGINDSDLQVSYRGLIFIGGNGGLERIAIDCRAEATPFPW